MKSKVRKAEIRYNCNRENLLYKQKSDSQGTLSEGEPNSENFQLESLSPAWAACPRADPVLHIALGHTTSKCIGQTSFL